MVAAINKTRRVSIVRKTDGRLALILQGEKPMIDNSNPTRIKEKRVSLRSLVIAYYKTNFSINTSNTEIKNAREAMFAAIAPKPKKEKAPKVARVKKESKGYDAMLENPRGTVERVMRYFVTQDGRKDLGEYPAAIFQPAAVSLVNVLNS